jgi:hypothetical protein
MSDISFNWGPLDYAMIALFMCGPGALLGLTAGAVLWHGHRVRGALFGGIAGFLLLMGYWHVYIESSLSRSDGPGMAALKSLTVAWPGVAIGGIAGAWLCRKHRPAGAIAGAAAGFVLWLYGWWLLA